MGFALIFVVVFGKLKRVCGLVGGGGCCGRDISGGGWQGKECLSCENDWLGVIVVGRCSRCETAYWVVVVML